MCSGSEAGSYLRLTDIGYHSTLGLRVIKKKKGYQLAALLGPDVRRRDRSSPPPQKKSRSMYYGEHGEERREREERERGNRLHSPFALHAPIQWAIKGYVPRPHTVGYIGVCDQEE